MKSVMNDQRVKELLELANSYEPNNYSKELIEALNRLQSQLTQVTTELEEAVAACAVKNSALKKAIEGLICASTFRTFDSETQKDYSYHDSLSYYESTDAVKKALSTSAGAAFLDRMKEAERLLNKNNAQLGEYASWNGEEPLNRAAMMIVENDKWLTPTDAQKEQPE